MIKHFLGRANNCSSVYLAQHPFYLILQFQYSEGYQEYKSDPEQIRTIFKNLLKNFPKLPTILQK